GSGLKNRRLGRAGVLRGFLVAQSDRDRARHSDDSLSAGNYGAVSAADWSGTAALGAREGRRLRSHARDALEIPDLRRVFPVFVPSLTGVVAFWSTVALNIPDFTRYARGQREQMLGQALGLPTTMTFYSFIGIAGTSATVVLFGRAIWDPVEVLSRLGNPIAVVVAMLALLLATLNVNVAANVVSPSND